MELSQLEYFLKLASLEHMSRAAVELNISQPALSANIRKLEAELGVELFTRHGRRLELNDYGTYLQEQLTPLMEKMNETFEVLREMQYADRSKIVVDAEPVYTFAGLPEKIDEVLSLCPGATVQNVRYPIHETFVKILNDEVDFAVMGIDRDHPEMEKILLSKDELVMLVHKSHPLAKRTYASLADFSRDKFAAKIKDGLPAQYDMASERCCKEAGFSPNIVFKSASRSQVIDTVRSCHYSHLAPINTISSFRLDDLSVVHISSPECYACLWMYWKKGKKERPPVKALRESIIDFFQSRNL